MPDADEDEWLSIQDAAHRLGISVEAVMRQVAQGSLVWRPEANHGRPIRITSQSDPIDLLDEFKQLQAEIDELREKLARAEAERDTAMAEVAAKVELVEELRAMLAEARRPWWRRFT